MINRSALSQRSITMAIYIMICMAIRSMEHVYAATTSSKTVAANNTECQTIPLMILKQLHKPAFNRNYMSADSPFTVKPRADLSGGIKVRRKTEEQPAMFEMNDGNFQLLSNEPAWNVDWSSIAGSDEPTKQHRKRDLRPIEVKLNADDSPDDADREKSEESDENESVADGQHQGADWSDNWNDETDTFAQKKRSDPPWRCETRRKWIELSRDYYPRYLRSVQCTKPKCWYGNYGCVAKKMSVRILQRHSGDCTDAANLKQLGFGSRNAELWRWVKVDINFFCECAQPDNGRFPFEW